MLYRGDHFLYLSPISNDQLQVQITEALQVDIMMTTFETTYYFPPISSIPQWILTFRQTITAQSPPNKDKFSKF